MNRREINKLEREMQQLTSYIAHTPDKKAKMLYADHLMTKTQTYIRLVYQANNNFAPHSQQVNSCSVISSESPVGTYIFEGGEKE